MKIYLLRTNGNNAVVITDGKTAKIFDGAKLRERYESAVINGTIERDYRSIRADHEIPARKIADELSELQPVYEMVA